MAIAFNKDTFGTAMNGQSAISLDAYNATSHGWSGDGNKMEYSHGDWDYRTWLPDQSPSLQDAVILVSCKIDQDRSGKDDHLVLIGFFNRAGNILAVQAGVESIKHNAGGNTGVIYASSDYDSSVYSSSDAQVISAFESQLLSAIADARDGNPDSGLDFMANIAVINLRCIQESITYAA